MILTTRLLLDTHIVVLKFVDEQKIEKIPSLNYMSAIFTHLCGNAPKVCCASIIVHKYANDK